jgi:amino acid adenylation domain-containing protein
MATAPSDSEPQTGRDPAAVAPGPVMPVHGTATPLSRRRATSPSPPSFAQERLWFFDQFEPQSPVYHIARALHLDGPLDLGALQAALDVVVARHEAIRTSFEAVDGRPVPRIAAPGTVPLGRVDLESRGARADSRAVARLLVEDARRPFDLSRDLMLRATLFRLGPERHILLLVIHHIASDGWSVQILLREMAECYSASASGRTARLPDLAVQYGDYAQWQRDRLRGPILERALTYWARQLRDLAPLELPADRPRPARQSYRGAREPFAIPAEVSAALKLLGRQARVTLFMTLLAAFQTLLHRYSARDDITVGSPVAGRLHPQIEGLIGFFVNTLVLRTDLSGDPSFRTLLGRVHEIAVSAYEHQELPFERLVAELQPARTLSHAPLVQVMLALDSTPPAAVAFPGLIARTAIVDTDTAKCDLTLAVRDTAQGLVGSLEYCTDLFDPATVRRMLGHFERLLTGITAEPDQKLSELPLLNASERCQIVVEWNDTRRSYPADRSIAELFEAQVAEAPDAIALTFERACLSYGDLDRRANQLAHRLQALGVGPEVPVALCVERSLEMIVGLLGILKAGGAYVPLDPTYPKQRLAFMLEDTQTPVLLTQDRLRAALPAHGPRILSLDADWPAVAGESEATPTSQVTPEHLAYVMYTSGSTGWPKGVSVPHRAVVRLVKNTSYARLTADEVFLQLAPLAFDASTFEIWGSLLNGARLAIAPPGVLSVAELGQVLRRDQVTTLWLTAAFFHQVVEQDLDSLGPVRQLLAGGDVLSVPHVKSLLRGRPGCRLINGYGPTESTTFACCFDVTANGDVGSSVLIGRPIANTRAYVLGRARELVPIGVPGELYLGGDGLARGYLNRPDLTAERLIPDPFSDRPDARLYRTGDLVRYRPDGNIEFLGRMDDQVKIRGFRVEPAEIEAVLRQHPALRDAVVVAREEAPGEKALVGYCVTRGELSEPPIDELRRYLAERLPVHMIPANLVRLTALPLTASGKVDRAALPVPSIADRVISQAASAGPTDAVEAQLVEIWEDVLGVRPIGTADDFFQLGGHSLLAVQMFARLREGLGVTLPLATLFQAPTIAGLAASIRESPRLTSLRSLVAIRPTGSRPPVFAVPGVGGIVLCYSELAQLLSRDQPFYGLQSRGLDGLAAPLTRIEDIAAAFVDEIRAVQPEGPYYLVGTCMGGVVTWEMAQQLRGAGQEVGLLALLETWPPMPGAGASWSMPPRPRGRAILEFTTGRLRLHLETLRRLRGRERLRYLRQRAMLLADRLFRRDILGGNRPEFYLQIVTQANLLAFQRYEPRAFGGPVVLVRADGRDVQSRDDRRLVWRELAIGGLEVHSIAADDSGLMLVEPHVRLLAQQLGACLERAQTAAYSVRRTRA